MFVLMNIALKMRCAVCVCVLVVTSLKLQYAVIFVLIVNALQLLCAFCALEICQLTHTCESSLLFLKVQ